MMETKKNHHDGVDVDEYLNDVNFCPVNHRRHEAEEIEGGDDDNDEQRNNDNDDDKDNVIVVINPPARYIRHTARIHHGR